MTPRVLLVIGQLERGGAEVQLVRLARGLAQRGWSPEVAVFHPGGPLEAELAEAGIPVLQVRRTSKVGLEAIAHLARILRAGGHAVVHSFLWPANWRARVAGILAGVPAIVASVRSVEVDLRPWHVAVDRLLAHRTDALVVNAAAIRDFLIDRERLPRGLFRVIPNGLDVDRYEPATGRHEARVRLGLPPAPVVLTVGNLHPEKNHADFVRMAARVRAVVPEAVFVSVGGGECGPALARQAAELGVADRIVWAGPQPDVRPWLAAADVAVNTSRREGCCNAILEAMAAGLPVAAYAVGGNPELVDDGRTGRIVPFGDVEGLALAVAGYLVRPEAARQAGEAGRQVVRARHGTGVMVERTLGLYRELLGRRPARAVGVGA